MNIRTFSEKPKFRVTEKDLLEFNSWINSKKITPRLREFFDSDLDYENFMVDYQDKTNDPVITGNEKTFSESARDYYKRMAGLFNDEHKKLDMSDPNSKFKITKDNAHLKWLKAKADIEQLKEDYNNKLSTLESNAEKLYEEFKKLGSRGPGSKRTFSKGSDSMREVKIEYNKFSSTKQFDAIPKDHPTQDLGTNSFIVVKVSPIKGDYYYYDIISELHPWFDLVSKTKPGQNVPKLIDKKFIVTPQTNEIYLKDANEYLQDMSRKLGLKLYSDGECPESGCVQKKPNGKWGVISNKTGKFWDADYESEDKAKAALAAYHANKAFSELSDKLFADLTVNNDPSIISKKTSGTNSHSVGDVVLDTQVPTITADWNETKPFNLSVEPWVVANCINDKADGLYIGSLLGDNIDIGNSHISIDIKSGSPQPVEVLVLLKNGKAFIYKRNQLASRSKTFSEGMQYDYRFSIVPTEISYEMSYVIGSWMMAASVCHLYHICDQKYSGHMALDEFYNDFPEKIDALAEHYLADNEKAEFRVCVVPHECPIDYLTRLVEFTMKYSELNGDKISSPYQSQLDDIVNFTKGILYKLKRLGSGRRIFSVTLDKSFSQDKYSKYLDKAADIILEVIDPYITKNKVSIDKVFNQYIRIESSIKESDLWKIHDSLIKNSLAHDEVLVGAKGLNVIIFGSLELSISRNAQNKFVIYLYGTVKSKFEAKESTHRIFSILSNDTEG